MGARATGRAFRRGPTTSIGRLAGCVVLLALSLALVQAVTSGGAARGQTDDELVVATFEVPPFVERTGDVPGGFMFEVWEQVADRRGWDFEVVWIESLDDLGALVDDGGIDVAVAPLASTSEREARFDFTSAVVASGPVFGVHRRTENPVTLASALFNADILRLLGWSVVGLVVLGHLMWWVDRRNPDSDFDEGYARGVWDGVWWATVTVTTVGYGDTSPKTSGGRVVAMLAMLGSLFLVGAFVSEVTTALQSGRAETVVADVSDLDGRSVGVLEGSSYEAFLDERGVDTVAFESQLDALAAADDGAIDIVAADRFTLDAVGSDFGLGNSGDTLFDEYLGFAVRDGSDLLDDIDATIADLHQEGVIREIVDRWTD